MALENKQTLLFRLYQVLYEYSDVEHPLTQQQIIELLRKDYGLEVERKAIGRNVSYLREMGYDICSVKNGCFLAEKLLEPSELRLLIDSVLSSRHINASYSKQLLNKLALLGGKYFKSHVKHIYSVNDWGKSQNRELFLNIDLIDEAIEQNKQIIFEYNKLGTDKQLHKTYKQIASPYQMVLHNQRYYLMAYNNYWNAMRFYRLDKITAVEILEQPATPIRSIEGYENGINYAELANAHPYMYSDKPGKITIKCDKGLVDELPDWFGADFKIIAAEEDSVNVEIVASPMATVYWALQFGDNAEVLSPPSVRQRVKEMLQLIIKKYE